MTPLEVIETGDRCVYLVRSETNPRRVYRVDLLAHGGVGECLCMHWQTRVWPMVRDGIARIDDDLCVCKHLRAARRHFLHQLLAEMAKRFEPHPEVA